MGDKSEVLCPRLFKVPDASDFVPLSASPGLTPVDTRTLADTIFQQSLYRFSYGKLL
jgi:hypothetical protein